MVVYFHVYIPPTYACFLFLSFLWPLLYVDILLSEAFIGPHCRMLLMGCLDC